MSRAGATAGGDVGLVVLADHWGRHPSSAQHLVRRLLDRYRVSWINTVGTRRPQLTVADAGRVLGYLKESFFGSKVEAGAATDGPEVVSPVMLPGFRSGWQRALNRRAMARAIRRSAAGRCRQTVGLTTLPITADLVGMTGVDRWIYYAVDDFSVWPGLDHEVMASMERELVGKVDRVVAVSETLRDRMRTFGGAGAEADLLTHGIELEPWRRPRQRARWPELETDESVLLFWGVIDRRLDVGWCRRLASMGRLVLAGPEQDPPAALAAIDGVVRLGKVAYEDLPSLAKQADVLVMPYADLPVTRAMQPLKFKEYLATGQPVVARALPGIAGWSDAAWLVGDEASMEAAVLQGLTAGIPASQVAARERLSGEGWDTKAAWLDVVIRGVIGQRSDDEGVLSRAA
ncbi:glycosyltransferase [Mucisphaera sp.]|uniref:glycosyltransferase n=1 Tax=Mucisphaera sp. TaxID=2913024 RepID=UPI003D0D15B7